METTKGYKHKIEGGNEFPLLDVTIPQNQKLFVEASSMASMDSHISMKTRAKGGLGRLFTRESFFINEFTSLGSDGVISIAPGTPGDLKHIYLDNEEFFIQGSSFLACTEGVQRDTKWQGFTKGLFSGENFFMIKCSGMGDLWFNSFGAIFGVDVVGSYVVDTSHIVGFSSGLDYNVTKFGGYKSLFFSGEGLVCRFTGKGRVYIQTKNPKSFVWWADQFRIVQKSNNS